VQGKARWRLRHILIGGGHMRGRDSKSVVPLEKRDGLMVMVTVNTEKLKFS
jgi:hypothetical protein